MNAQELFDILSAFLEEQKKKGYYGSKVYYQSDEITTRITKIEIDDDGDIIIK